MDITGALDGAHNLSMGSCPLLSHRLLWAELMRHTFIADVLVCPKCQTGMQMIALISQPSVIDRLMIYDQEARGPPSP